MSLTRQIMLKAQRNQSSHRSKLPYGLKVLAVISVSLAFILFITSRGSCDSSTSKRVGGYPYTHQRFTEFKQFEVLMKVQEKKMLFIETTEGEDFCLKLRQSCAVESAARMNPEAAVILLLRASSTSPNCTTLGELEKLPNVEVIKFTIDEIFEGTPLMEWGQRVQSGNVTSVYMKAHLSDALRLALVHKYSAIYLDLDFIVLRSFDQLFAYEGFVAREVATAIAQGLIGFRGRTNFTTEAMLEFSSTYRGDIWSFNGPQLMMRLIERWGCHLTDASCRGVRILDPIAFYPVHWSSRHELFTDRSEKFASNLLNDERTLAVHFWNHLTYNTSSPTNHKNVLNICGQIKCPVTFQLATETRERNFD